MLNVIAPSFTGELKAKKKSHSEPKYSFEELSDEEESSGKNASMCICGVLLLVKHLLASMEGRGYKLN